MVDRHSEEQEIRSLIRQWVEAVGRKNPADIAKFYAADGRFLVPNAPISEGHDKIAAMWSVLLQLPNVALSFGPTLVEVAEAGDMAYDLGTYSLSYDGPSGRVADRGKYVVVWKKVGAAWKAAADILNSDLPKA